MLQRLLLTTAIAALALTPALAQDSTTGTPPPPEPLAQDQAAPLPPDNATQPPADMAAEEAPATPPPAEAIIPAENATDLRADKLIGTTVYNVQGDEVGEVEDIVFDQNGQIVGVVLKIGGLLGIGGKSVGIKWDEVDVSPQEALVTISYDREQLEIVPDFKTQEALQYEQSAPPPAAPPPAAPPTTAE
jgi:sporulation protein YlmC with PRC-barrel domain